MVFGGAPHAAVILRVMAKPVTLTAVFTPDENGWVTAQLASGPRS